MEEGPIIPTSDPDQKEKNSATRLNGLVHGKVSPPIAKTKLTQVIDKGKGWKAVRENVKRKKFTEGLRESGLQLHDMDECAPSRKSNMTENRRKSVAVVGEALLLNNLTTIKSGEDITAELEDNRKKINFCCTC